MFVENIINPSTDPESYEEAINSEAKIEWKKAMDTEVRSLKEN